MNRVLVRANIMVAIDSDEPMEVIIENFYARLSELVQSEAHMMEAEVDGFDLPGNIPTAGEAIAA